MLASTKRVWKLDETCLFKTMLFLFLMQYFFGMGLHLFSVASLLLGSDSQAEDDSSWFDGFFLALNAAIFVVLMLVLRLQERHYEIDDADEEEVLRVINWLPFLSVSATYPLSQLRDVAQIMHKGEACVRAVIGERELLLNPEDQEYLTSALSAYLPHDHPNRGVDGVARVYMEEDYESICRPWPCRLTSGPTPIHSSPAIEATWSRLRTCMGSSMVWLFTVAVVTYIVSSLELDHSDRVGLWLLLFVLSTLVSFVAGGLWNMGNIAEYRIHESKLQVASSLPFACAEDHHLKYVSSVRLVSGTEARRLSLDEQEPKVFVLGDFPCPDEAARQSHVYLKRKAGLLDLIIMPANPARFADALARQVGTHPLYERV